jgi:hypothetical protein
MTRKHFKALAQALKSERPSVDWGNKHLQWTQDVKAIAEVCAKFNEDFDFNRFFEACGAKD